MAKNKEKVEGEKKAKKTNACLMEHMTVNEVRQALRRTKTVLVPLGVLEQHGYHLSLNTDIQNACQISRRVSEKTGSLVAPPLNYSFSGGTLPGTINISPQTMSLVVADICQSLAQQGFKNIILILGHGGTENTNALKDVTTLFLRTNPHLKDLVLALVPVWEFSAVFKGSFHAGSVETSLMLYWAPEDVRKKIAYDTPRLLKLMRKHQDNYLRITKKVDSEYVIPYMEQRPDIKVGVMGYPEKADVETGRKVCGECVRGITKLIRQIEARKKKAKKVKNSF